MSKRTKDLVTGAGGFIGDHPVTYLKGQGYRVRGVDIKYPESKPTDAGEFELLNLRCWDNCPQATRHVKEVYVLAADMGGMGFISANYSQILHNNLLINVHTLDAAVFTGMENGILKDPLQKPQSFAKATTDGWSRAVASYRNNSGWDWTDIVLHLLTTDYVGTVYLDAVQYEFKSYPTPYCDGSLGDGHAWGGDGTPHANISTRTEAVRSGSSSHY